VRSAADRDREKSEHDASLVVAYSLINLEAAKCREDWGDFTNI
jgi:hypothetical protein